MYSRLAIGMLVAVLPLSAQATNWLQLQGTEAPNTPAFKLFGFVQPTYTAIDANPITGLAGSASKFNGQYTVPNLVGPDLESKDNLQFMRARLGARGNLTDSINYFVLGEAGKNGVTSQHDLMLLDSSVTFNAIPGARIRAGLFKVPTGEEALVAVQTSFPYIYYTNTTQNLLQETEVQFNGGTFSTTGASTANTVSGASGFRDWGVQAFDWLNKGPWEYSYAAMLSNGNAIKSPADNDGNRDLTLRFQTSYIFGNSKGPNREDFSAYVWHQQGKREFDNQDFNRIREGLGAKYLKGDWRLSGEYMRGDGMIVSGPNPPFPDQATQVGVNEKAHGWYVEGGWRFLPKLEADVRYEDYDRMTANAALEREFKTTTFGLQYFINKSTHVTFNYEWRDMKVPNPSALSGANLTNALDIANNLGDRISTQLTWMF